MERESRIGVVKEKKLPGFARQETLRFIRDAIRAGALQRAGRNARFLWARNLGITGIYLYTDATLQEIGDKYRVKRQAVEQIKRKTLTRIWDNCSPRMREQYPLPAVILGKPRTRRAKEQVSLRRGGISVKVAGAIKEGKTVAEIKKNGLTGKQITEARHVLQNWGVKVPPGRILAGNRKP